jgi:hypothetical protein
MLEEVVVVVSVEEEAEVVTLAVRMGVQEGLEERNVKGLLVGGGGGI